MFENVGMAALEQGPLMLCPLVDAIYLFLGIDRTCSQAS